MDTQEPKVIRAQGSRLQNREGCTTEASSDVAWRAAVNRHSNAVTFAFCDVIANTWSDLEMLAAKVLSLTDADGNDQPSLLAVMDFDAIVNDVYGLVSSSEDIAGPVREAVQVIEDAIDSYGYVYRVLSRIAF